MKLRAGVVGLKMGKNHISAFFDLEEFDLVAICDLDTDLANEISLSHGNPKVFSNYDQMLAEAKLDVIAVATPNNLHAPMTIKAANAGIKGVYCEKPMAMNMKEARSMKEACDNNGVSLVIGHQRRTTTPYTTMQRLVKDGAIGDVYMIRGICPGDCLSDGTHTVDSVVSILGNPKPVSILGQIHRENSTADATGKTGFRYGHPVESGAMAVVVFDNNVRFELYTGDLKLNTWDAPYPGWAYQDIEIFGSKGRIWRCGDSAEPAVRIWDDTHNGWQAAKLDPEPGIKVFNNVFKEFYLSITEGKPHPMSAENAILTQEIIMGVYESARLGKRLSFPIEQDAFPLQLLLDEGRK